MSLATPRKGYKSVPWLFGKEIEIPDEWEVKKCSKTLELKHGYQFRDEDFIQGGKGIKIIKIGNLKKNGSIDSNNCDIISLDRKSDFLNIVINSGDVLMALTGATLGKIIQVPKINEILLQNYRVGNFFPKKDIDKNFLYYVLKNIFTQKQIWFLVNSGAQPNIGKEDFDKIKIICPPLPEQQKIATILSNVDNLIESTEKVITHSKKVKTGLMQKLLTRGIGHTKFKKVNFGRHFIDYDIPEEWKISRLGDHTTVHGRIGWKNLRSNEYLEEGFLMLSVWSLVETASFGINYTEGVKRLSKFRYEESPEIQLQNNDILIAKDGDIGRIGYIKNLPEPATVNSHVVPVRVTDKIINPEFLYWFFKSKPFQTYCKAFTSGTTIPLFTQKDLRNCMIPIPKKEEQDKIATILSNVDSKITSQEQYKEKLEKLKKSLMQKLLTGEVRV